MEEVWEGLRSAVDLQWLMMMMMIMMIAFTRNSLILPPGCLSLKVVTMITRYYLMKAVEYNGGNVVKNINKDEKDSPNNLTHTKNTLSQKYREILI